MKVSLLAAVGLLSCLLPANVPAARAQAADPSLTELTQLARRFPRHRGPTILYVNFDGWKNHDGKGHDIQPFQSINRHRDREIQLILFRTAEMFAPFDVQVRRLRGNGKYDRGKRGNTTIFVGAHTNEVNGKGEKVTHSFAPEQYTDRPATGRGADHRPNSDPFDIAFVDPVGQKGGGWATVEDNDLVGRHIAHEAGHTFGLVHTLTAPVRDLMSYNADVKTFFANRTFPITDLNFDAAQGKADHAGEWQFPLWGKQRIMRQNSYTYLRAVLGARQAGCRARVADRRAVDPSFRDGPLALLAPGKQRSGAVGRRGDYGVFVLRPKASGRLTVRVRPSGDSELAPVVFVFDAAGRKLLRFANGRGRAGRLAQATVQVKAGKSFKVVVGGADGASTGAYRVWAGLRSQGKGHRAARR